MTDAERVLYMLKHEIEIAKEGIEASLTRRRIKPTGKAFLTNAPYYIETWPLQEIVNQIDEMLKPSKEG